MVVQLDRGHHRHLPVPQHRHRVPERRRGKLHLAELVHHDHPAALRRDQRRQRDPLERLQVHAVPPDAWRARHRHMREDAAVTRDRLHHEALPAPAHPDLVGHEPTQRDPGIAE
jgi:hypothetical protein